MGAALAGAFIVGHWLLSDHWLWVVLTAYIVCAGNPVAPTLWIRD
jgi:uncharacterized membrane protein YccC